MKAELLAPAGNMEKFYTALHFGADAVYLSGKRYGLRAFADNFEIGEIADCCAYAHRFGKKVYITLNVYARNRDLEELPTYLNALEKAGADAVIVSDPGVIRLVKKHSRLPVHLSTQANTVNYEDVLFWAEQGVKRTVLARELSLTEISEIAERTKRSGTELEMFVHGAMCVSYSGRCLLSNYLSSRDSNLGECVQACRWEYRLREISRQDELTVEEDGYGTYFLNSKDLCLWEDLPKLLSCGIHSLKIEGRMKTVYYVATVVDAYRRAIDAFFDGKEADPSLKEQLYCAPHREYTAGFCFPERRERTENRTSSKAVAAGEFLAVVKKWENGRILVEQRNRFREGDVLTILSSDGNSGKTFVAENMRNEEGESVTDAKLVQQRLWLPCPYPLRPFDLLHRVKRCKEE